MKTQYLAQRELLRKAADGIYAINSGCETEWDPSRIAFALIMIAINALTVADGGDVKCDGWRYTSEDIELVSHLAAKWRSENASTN